MIKVSSQQLLLSHTLCQRLLGNLQILKTYQNQLSGITNHDVVLQELRNYHASLEINCKKLVSFLDESKAVYENAERQIVEKTNAFAEMKNQNSIVQKQDQPKMPFWDYDSSFLRFQHGTHSSFTDNKTLLNYFDNGICAGAFVSFTAASFTIGKHMKYLQVNANTSFAKAKVSVDGRIHLFENKKWNPSVILSGEAGAYLGQLKGDAHIGNSYISTDAEAIGSVGVATAEAKAVINKEEVTIKAEAGVAALKGEVKASFSIFGFKITLSGSGEIGSLGCGAEFSSKSREVEFGGKFSFIAGLGFKVKVNY